MNHKVFISYAGEDKERFVLGFATKLREQAVDAWVAEWEIAAGDSIVRQVFGEGLGRADAIIIVLSRYSVDKPWVRAELDVAKVRQIEERTRLIPVVLEECDVPVALRATRRETVKDLNNYDTVVERVVMAINEMYARPPLGRPPSYTIVHQDNRQSDEIAEVLDKKHLLILHILESLEVRQLVKLSKMSGPMKYVSDYSPELKYLL